MNAACAKAPVPARVERPVTTLASLLVAAAAGLGLAVGWTAAGAWVRALAVLAALPVHDAVVLWARFFG